MVKISFKNPSFLYGGFIYVFSFLLILTFPLKSEIKNIKNADKKNVKKILDIKKYSTPFQIYYIFDKKFCARCYNAEIHRGWLKTPKYLKNFIQVIFISNNKNLKKYLNKNDTDRYKVTLYPTSKIKKLKNHLNKAIFYDKNNDKLFEYKISSNDFGVLYRYFDSILYNNEQLMLSDKNVKLDKSINSGIPSYVKNLSLSYDLINNNLILFSNIDASLWEFNDSLNLVLHSSLYKNIISKKNKGQDAYYYRDICLNKNRIYANSVLLSNPYDTVIYNTRSKRWRHFKQQLVYYTMDTSENKIFLDSAINQEEAIGTFTKSINTNFVWGVYSLSNKDTVGGIFKLFYINNDERKYFPLPLKYYSGNPEFSSSYNNSLYTFNPYGKIFIIDTNKNVKTIIPSYYKNDKRILTFFDGKHYSITNYNGNYSYLVVYNDIGIRQFLFTTKKFNAYYLFNSNTQKIYEITKQDNGKSAWLINIYKID